MAIKNLVLSDYQHVAVISDIHSNFHALTIVIEELQKQPLDAIICLGDLLTYGPNPRRVLDLLRTFQNTLPIFFLKGNHDQFYFDLQGNIINSLAPLPAFLQESILWNLQQLDETLLSCFQWEEAIALGGLYFAHANPFPYGNWMYLNDEDNLKAAALRLQQIGYRWGCFGHTHRSVHYVYQNVTILNPGSVGQPRGDGSSYAYLNFENGVWHFELRKINYPVSQHIHDIETSSLSRSTKEKLIGYFLQE